jgi:cytochrome d ubiquinol oxidase subunit II
MTLADLPMVLILVGLTAYVVLGGADFGAGLWYMLLGGDRRRSLRDHTYHAMGPVWEANHVWLIFVLVVAWTAYPRAFGSVASTLYVPLFVAAVGIILRGSAYALRSWVEGPRAERLLGLLFGVSSLLAPFALGTVVGALASRRVPVGNAAGEPFGSWTGPTSILIGALAVATSAYLAAVWLTADAARAGRDDLVAAFRRRALGAALVAGGLALAGVFVLHSDARRIFEGLTSGAGLAAVIASTLAGAATLALVVRGRFEAARIGSAIAVAGIVAGWAFAQRPEILPGLDVHQAAASDPVLIAVLVAAGIGALVLVPSLALLFGMVLRGRFDERPQEPGSVGAAGSIARDDGSPRLGPVALALAVAGAGLVVVTEGGVGRVAGVILLLAGLACLAAFALPRVVDEPDDP